MNTNINNSIRSRRSIYPKQMSGQSIPIQILENALEAANWAPTHKKTQPWRFMVYSGEAKNKLIAFWERMTLENTLEKGETWDEIKASRFRLYEEKNSHIIALACEYSGQVPAIEETLACGAAIQNFWLSLSEAGYGGYWSTGNGTFSFANKQFHQLKENQELVGYFLCGVPEGTLPLSARKPIEDLSFWFD